MSEGLYYSGVDRERYYSGSRNRWFNEWGVTSHGDRERGWRST